MNINKILLEISKNFLRLDQVKGKSNLFICLIDEDKEYTINITEPEKIINDDFNPIKDLCICIEIKDALNMLEGKLNVNDSLFKGNIELRGNLDVLSRVSSEIEKTT
tara:strand:+ start:770 stop:1090 length:321 start_codon:yes stop_codon:yes gene_type:complete